VTYATSKDCAWSILIVGRTPTSRTVFDVAEMRNWKNLPLGPKMTVSKGDFI